MFGPFKMFFIFVFLYFLNFSSTFVEGKPENTCLFVDEKYELGDKWKVKHASINEVCLRCICVKRNKKNKNKKVKIRCANIKSKCPKPDCKEPYLPKDGCCYVCPGQNVEEIEDEAFILKLNESPTRKKKVDPLFRMLISSLDSEPHLGNIKNYQKDGNHLIETVRKSDCSIENKIYKNGDQWKSTLNKCEMCFCDSGTIRCDTQICPKLNCKNQTKHENECCNICLDDIKLINNNSKELKCNFDWKNVNYRAGSVFHPYLPPLGFDECIVCHCKPKTLKINCKRICENAKNIKNKNLKQYCPNCTYVSFETTDYLKKKSMNNEEDPDLDLDLDLNSNESGSCVYQNNIIQNGDYFQIKNQFLKKRRCLSCQCKVSSSSKC